MKPILFNTAMVKAIIDGRKTVTRRIVNRDIVDGCDIDVDGTILGYQNCYGDFINPIELCRYRKGDVLWVRETWCKLWHLDDNEQIIEGSDKYYYAADGYNPTPFNCFPDADGFHGERDCPKWKPSIHMPKSAARIFLKVTGVKLEKLQEITAEQCADEGINIEGMDYRFEAVSEFASLWNSTINKQDFEVFGWDANPWVWVIEFERCEKLENEL